MTTDELLYRVDVVARTLRGWAAYIDVVDPAMPGTRITGVGTTPRQAILDAIRQQPKPQTEDDDEL